MLALNEMRGHAALRFALVLLAVSECSAQTTILGSTGSDACPGGSTRVPEFGSMTGCSMASHIVGSGNWNIQGAVGVYSGYTAGCFVCNGCVGFPWPSDGKTLSFFMENGLATPAEFRGPFTPICWGLTPTPTPAPTACSPVPSTTGPANVPSTHAGFVTISGVFFSVSDSTTSSFVSDQLSLYVVRPNAAPCDRRSVDGIGTIAARRAGRLRRLRLPSSEPTSQPPRHLDAQVCG